VLRLRFDGRNFVINFVHLCYMHIFCKLQTAYMGRRWGVGGYQVGLGGVGGVRVGLGWGSGGAQVVLK
jgi:hypothetical protein